ncbi:MAG TPA: DUF1287 domain-containing protein [Pyrinomonadaceae bacterium]|jgi:hypothetical protein|nr:DUF1287 domain-containing protein [Pyrinomonadaceae bacterium]
MQLRRASSSSLLLPVCLILLSAAGCQRAGPDPKSVAAIAVTPTPSSVARPLAANASPQLKQLVEAAVEQSKVTTGYDPSWARIDYPNGDVPQDTGVCSDVVVRAFRKAGIDLQQEVHEDMTRAWSEYPRRWGASRTDTNIDHRRVLNLMTYFDRQAKSLPLTDARADYLPGDVIAWQLSDGVEHIGIMTNLWSEPDKHCLVVHNIGAGARIEDVLLAWKIIGHYRYF